MPDPLVLRWHHFGTLYCLIQGKNTYSLQLLPQLPGVVGGAGSDVATALATHILGYGASRNRTVRVPVGEDLDSSSNALDGLTIQFARMPTHQHKKYDMRHEMILSERALYLPWPLFWGVGATHYDRQAFEEAVEQAIPSPIPRLPQAVLKAPHVRLHATMSAADVLVDPDRPGPSRPIDGVPPDMLRPRLTHEAFKAKREYGLGLFAAERNDAEWMGRTRFEIDQNGQKPLPERIRLVLCTQRGVHHETLGGVPLDDAPAPAPMPEWPCGAFDIT